MKEQDLFQAIGGVDDAFLAELETPHIRRLPKRFGLIAAMLAFVLTACAAPAIIQHFDALKNGGIVVTEHTITWADLWENPEAHFAPNSRTITLLPNTVTLEVAVSEDAPETIQQHHLPLALFDYCAVENWSSDDTLLSLEFSMDIPRYGSIRGILYQQHVLPDSGQVALDSFVGPGMWEEALETYGEISALDIFGHTTYVIQDGNSRTGHIYTKHIFWSDGHYLYCLKIPITYKLSVTKVEEIVTSLTPVEDITQYLPTPEP